MPRRSMKRCSIYLCFCFVFILGGCATVYNPATGRKEMILIGTQQEASLGRDMDVQLRRELEISQDRQLLKRLDRIFSKVAAASDRQDLQYHVRIVNDKELNAFAVPGGYVYVHTGLMERATDDELACVLAHELGHIAARHSIKHLQAQYGYQLLLSIALGVTGDKGIAQATDIIFNLTVLGYSRHDENEADRLSVRYAVRSGYDPKAIITFFKKLKKEQQERGPNLRIEMLSSHPDLDTRIKNVEAEITLTEP